MTVEAGSFTDSEIIVMLGENGTGKTTFIRMLAGAPLAARMPARTPLRRGCGCSPRRLSRRGMSGACLGHTQLTSRPPHPHTQTLNPKP